MAVAAVLSAVRRPRSPRLPTDSTDEQLARRAAEGDEAAFEAIYDRYAPALLAFCRQLLGSPEEAEDALQQSLARAYGALRGGAAPSCLQAWLYAIARNRCLTSLAARRDVIDLDAVRDTVAPADDCYAEVQRRADVGDLVDDLRRLPHDQRVALVLFELGGHSQSDIAGVLGVLPERVKALVFQAREGLARAREARAAACRDIVEELAVIRGAIPRRGPLADHLARCDGCAAFATEVARQRRALAVVILPPVALKAKVLGSALTGGGGAAVAVGGTGGTGGAGIIVAVAGGGAATGGGALVAGAGGGGALGAAVAGTAGLAGVGGLASVGAGGVAAGLVAKGVVAKILTAVAIAGTTTAVAAPPAARPARAVAPSPIAPFVAGHPLPKPSGPADEPHTQALPSSAPGPADQPPAPAAAPAPVVAGPATASTTATAPTSDPAPPSPAAPADPGGAEAPAPAAPASAATPDPAPADTGGETAAAAPTTTADPGGAQPVDPKPIDTATAGGAQPTAQSW